MTWLPPMQVFSVWASCASSAGSGNLNARLQGVTKYVEHCYPGPLVRQEVKYLGSAMTTPKRLLCVVLGGAKVADKIGVMWSMIEKADVVIVGGRMAFTFLAAQGISVGETQIEKSWLEVRESGPPAAVGGLHITHQFCVGVCGSITSSFCQECC